MMGLEFLKKPYSFLFFCFILFYWKDTLAYSSRRKSGGATIPSVAEHKNVDFQQNTKKNTDKVEIDYDGFLTSEFQVFGQSESMICRQVPGDGNCLFYAIAVGLGLIEKGVHPSNERKALWSLATRLRKTAVDYLQEDPEREIFLEGEECWTASILLEVAAQQYSTTVEKYCRNMRSPSDWGDGEEKWGGGPEIVALANYLKRPIFVYELMCKGNRFCFHRIACFGSPLFDDNTPLHILSADSRFPDVAPGRQLARGNHFLALFPRHVHEAAKENCRLLQKKSALQKSLMEGKLKIQALCGGICREKNGNIVFSVIMT